MLWQIRDNLTITPDALRPVLGLNSTDHDAIIQDCIDAAKEEADQYCSDWNFGGEMGSGSGSGSGSGDSIFIPAAVKLWVQQRAAMLYEQRFPSKNLEQTTANVGSVKWGDIDMSLLRNFVKNPLRGL